MYMSKWKYGFGSNACFSQLECSGNIEQCKERFFLWDYKITDREVIILMARSSGIRTFFRHVSILLRKDLRIQVVNWKAYLMLFLSPLFVMLAMISLQYSASGIYLWENANPDIYSLPKIPKCIGEDCITLAYATVGPKDPYIDDVMQFVKKENGFGDGDVKEWNMTPPQIMKHLQENPNKTQIAVVFCTSQWPINENISIPCSAQHYHMNFYTIIYNLTLNFRTPYFASMKEPYPKDTVTLKLKESLDAGILKHHLNSTLTLKMSSFPLKSSRFISNMNVISQYGSFFFLIPYLISFVLEVSSLLKEKEDRLRLGLHIVGVSPLEFHVSNIAVSAINNFFITLIYCVFGLILQIRFFTHGLLWFDFLVFWSNGVLLSLIGYLVVSLVNEKKIGMSISYGFVLYAIVMQWVFTGGFMLYFIYQNATSTLIKVAKVFFNIYPSFHYSKIFNDIERKADNHFDMLEAKWIEGNEFTTSDLFQITEGKVMLPTEAYVIPSAFQSYLYMLLTSIIYIVLVWYFDHIISSNRGKPYHPLFFLQPSYWCSKFRHVRPEVVMENHNQCLVSVNQLQKHYKKYPFSISSNEDIFALKGTSFDVERHEIVSILGKNGAGKSTLIGILTGILDFDGGSAKLCGFNIEGSMETIRKKIGVCPQFDILWDDLTAYEHLKLFGNLKEVPNLEDKIDKILEEFQLSKNRNGQVKTFSGGMKRRISLAISFMGDSEVIIMDEPTTGMDPKVRRLTWNLIKDLKKNRSIILTTHNMEEADCLSDRILVMASGKILASGTTLSLKNEFGSGYKLRLMSPKMQELVAQLGSRGFKGVVEEQELLIRSNKEEQLLKLLEYLEANESGLVAEWLISECSLEEVFLEVSRRY